MSDAPSTAAAWGVLRTLRTLPRPVTLLLVGIAINRTASFVGIFLILYLTHLGYDLTAAGAAVMAFGVGSTCGAYLGGMAAERFGHRRAIIASMLLSGSSAGVLAAEHGYAALLVVSVADGVFTQCYRPAAAAMIADLIPPQRLVMVTAASRLGLNIGATAAPLLGVWLSGISYSLMFTVDAASSLAFALIAFFALPRPGRYRPVTTQGNADPAGHRIIRSPANIGNRPYLLVLAGMFVISVAEIQYQTTLPLQIGYRGLPTWLYGAVVALNGAIVISCELPLTRFIQKLGLRVAIAVGVFFIGAGIAFFGLPGHIWVFVVGAIIWTAGEMISSPSLNSYPALIAPTARSRSRYIGALTACQTGGYAVGPVLGTALFAFEHSLVWFMCAALGVVAFVCMLTGVRYQSAR